MFVPVAFDAFNQADTGDLSKTVAARNDQDTASLVSGCWWDGGEVAATLTKQNANGAQRMPDKDNFGAVLQPVAFKVRGGCEGGGKGYLGSEEAAFTVATTQDQWLAQPISFGAQMSVPQTDVDLVQTLQAKNPMAVMQPIPYDLYQITAPVNRQNRKPGDPCHTLARDNAAHAAVAIQGTLIGRGENAGPQGSGADVSGAMFTLTKTDVHAVAQYIGGVDYENNAHGMDEATGPLLKGSPTGGGRPLPAIATAMQVRRLLPEECEKLQGFLPGYTNIPWRGKPESPDGPRYKALGNSMAVPVMRWIGERINKVEAL